MAHTTLINETKKIVVIGGGFAGINLIKGLRKSKYYDVTLVDKNNFNVFQPLVYQVATAFLEISSICYPFRKLLRKNEHLHFQMGEFIRVDPAAHICYLDNTTITYDYLVFATGTTTNYFGNETLKQHSIPMKTVSDATNMRNTLLQTLEQACIIKDPAERKKQLTIVITGGGPTGVEVAGVLAELRKNILPRDYPELANGKGDIYLVDGGSKLLAQMSEQSHDEAYRALNKLGVKIILNTTVIDFSNGKVVLSSGEMIEAKNLIWAAGVIAKTYDGIPATCIGRGKRMITDAYNKVAGIDDVYAIGDISIQKTDADFPDGHPQLAQPAIQQGRMLANNFIRMAKGKSLGPFKYIDKGTMAIIGRNKAVCDLSLFKSKLHVGGFVALLIWLFIHLVSLLNYRNKLGTLFNWVVAYLTKDQSLRMIIRPEPAGPPVYTVEKKEA